MCGGRARAWDGGAGLPELQDFLAVHGLSKYSWPESIEVFDDFPRTPSLKVVKRDVVKAILDRTANRQEWGRRTR